jgi:hypothetical protein
MRLIIFGDRKIKDSKVLKDAIGHFSIDVSKIEEVVCGLADGADTLGMDFAKENNIPVKEFKAEWDDLTAPGAVIKKNVRGKQYNAKAGFDRNQRMVDYADCGLALQSNGDTPGTQDCIERLRKSNKPIYVYSGVGSPKNADGYLYIF